MNTTLLNSWSCSTYNRTALSPNISVCRGKSRDSSGRVNRNPPGNWSLHPVLPGGTFRGNNESSSTSGKGSEWGSGSLGGNMREHRAGLEKGNAKADSAEIGGRLPGHTEQARVREQEDVKSDDRGVLVRRGSGDGMGAEESRRNTGSPRKQSIKAQTGIPRGRGLGCWGGGEARRSEDARNERRAKEPQFQGDATSGARAEIGKDLRPPEKLWKLQEALHANESMKSPWSESRMRENRTSGLMSGGVETGPLQDTAPPLDSTRIFGLGRNRLF